MIDERAPHVPAKTLLSWRISRLRLDPSGRVWLATASKGGRVAVIPLPLLDDPKDEAAWLARIEASFEAEAFDPTTYSYAEPTR